MSSRRASSLVLACLFVWGMVLGGCDASEEGEPRSLFPRFVDLAGDRVEQLEGVEGVETGLFFCHDQRRWGITLLSGAEIEVPLEMAASPVLRMEHCLRRAPGARAGPGRPSIELTVEDETGVLLERSVAVAPGWGESTVDLSQLAERSGLRLRLRASVRLGYRLAFKDLFIEQSERVPPPREPGAQVLLISLDTLREDAIGALGGHYPTPALDALAARSQVFSPHYSAASWTKPSHASLLTGELAAVHGVMNFEDSLAEGLPTLAERLSENGVATGALVYDCKLLEPRFGFARGFDTYEIRHWQVSTAARWAYEWIGEHRDQPFFFFLHSFETHSDFDHLPYEGPGAHRKVVEKQFGLKSYGCSGEICASSRLALMDRGEIVPLDKEGEILDFLYGKGVEEVDRALGMLFDALDRAGLLEKMTVIVTSDHGEEFFEHGTLLHGRNWEEILRVPLIVKWAQDRGAGEKEGRLTSALDLAPTILGLHGVSSEGLPGQPLSRPVQERAVFSGTHDRMVRRGFWKLERTRDGGRLFDLESDPGEQSDLIEKRPDIVGDLNELLLDRERRDGALARGLKRGEAELSPEEREQLEALGYLEANEGETGEVEPDGLDS